MKRADVVTVRSLFSGRSRYRCGAARQGFHWGPPLVAQLVVDLENAAHDSEDEEEVSEERFYLGIVTVATQKGGAFTLVDGQQRLIVLAMFLAFARDRMPTHRERNELDRLLVRRAFGRHPEPRLRLTPEDHAWFAHFILPPGATMRLPTSAPPGSPRELLLAARFMEHVFSEYDVHDLRSITDFLMHHTAMVRSLDTIQPFAPIARPALPAPPPRVEAPPETQNGNVPEPASRYRVAAE